MVLIGCHTMWQLCLDFTSYSLARRGTQYLAFFVLDQPSQVYFPRKLAGRQTDDKDPRLDDEDVAAVRKVFAVLGNAVKK